MQSDGVFEFGAVCLGAVGSTASWRREKKDVGSYGRWRPIVVVQTSSGTEDGAHQPAESVTICGVDALLALRAAIDEALKYEAGRSGSDDHAGGADEA